MGSQLLQLAGKAVRHPERALLRLVLKARLARTDPASDRARLVHLVSLLWGVDAVALLAELRRSPFARWYARRRRSLDAELGSVRLGSSDAFSCEALYLLVRAARPRVVVETGVLYGAASGHILAALEANGRGELHSVDLGCAPGEPSHDTLVPRALCPRWTYHVGDSGEVLPRLLPQLGRIDFFHHDSLHTFEHMTREFQIAARYLTREGVLSSHDVLVADGVRGIFRENAFPTFCRALGLPYFTVRNLGVAIAAHPWQGHAVAAASGAKRRRHTPAVH